MNPFLELILTLLFFVVYPIYWIVSWSSHYAYRSCLYTLHTLYGLVRFALQPVIISTTFIGRLLYIPFDLIARLETIYIYLGVGIFVGIVVGVSVHFTFRILTSILGLRGRKVKADDYKITSPAERADETAPSSAVESPRKTQKPSQMFPPPTLTLQSPSPEKLKRRTLLQHTLDADGYDSDLY